MKFYKMHGIGNDYIYIDCFQETIKNPPELAIRVSDRHFGVGGDGLVLILPSDVADCKMDMYNADGSRGKMCGNAIRCVAKFLFDQGRIENTAVTVETLSGIKKLKLNLENGKLKDVTVNMGAPDFTPGEVLADPKGNDPVISKNYLFDGTPVDLTMVSMGNPHSVLFVDSVECAPVEELGRKIEMSPIFRDRTNVEFIEIVDDSTIKMRVWERGSGETWACGTGACAAVAACVVNGKTKRDVCVKLTGGDLRISWDEKTGDIYMTGPATSVFYGFLE